MNRYIIVFILLIILTVPLYPKYSTGAGIYLGVPTGVRLKINLNNANSVAAIVAYDWPGSVLYSSIDYFYNFHYTAQDSDYEIPFFLYTGPGFRIKTDNDVHAGVKFNIGAGFMFSDIPVEFFMEVSPILDIMPATDLDMNAGIGFVFYFM